MNRIKKDAGRGLTLLFLAVRCLICKGSQAALPKFIPGSSALISISKCNDWQMLRAPPGCSSSGRLLRHRDSGLKTCSKQLCAQTCSDSNLRTGAAALSLPWEPVPRCWAQQGCGGLGTRRLQGMRWAGDQGTTGVVAVRVPGLY